MIRIFAGYDPREAVGYHVFCQSVIERTKGLVSITPLSGKQRDGTNAFTYQRFLVPFLCGYQGKAIFLDGSDMLMLADIEDLESLFDPRYAVQVVKHDYQTKHPKKYIGTPMEARNGDYPRKNWSSVVLWNCEHSRNRVLTPEFIEESTGEELHRFQWLPDSLIGDLPREWNVLVGEHDHLRTKIAHYTLGIPEFDHYADCDYSKPWFNTKSRMLNGLIHMKDAYAEH